MEADSQVHKSEGTYSGSHAQFFTKPQTFLSTFLVNNFVFLPHLLWATTWISGLLPYGYSGLACFSIMELVETTF